MRLLSQLVRCIAKGFTLPCQRIGGDSHLEIVITIGLFQRDLLC